MAASWYVAGDGKGKRDMVVLPYRDRLEVFSRYLQQLVMESLGKRLDRQGRVAHQGIAVYGNKGSTDQTRLRAAAAARRCRQLLCHLHRGAGRSNRYPGFWRILCPEISLMASCKAPAPPSQKVVARA